LGKIALEKLRFNEQGLLPAVTVDSETGQVLMLAYMNRESLKKTVDTGLACYYSRSRGSLWIKGESSGHFQKVEEILTDCDYDTVLLKVKQMGEGACHEGYFSCFHYEVLSRSSSSEAERKFDPTAIYGDKTGDALKEIYQKVVNKREKEDDSADFSSLVHRIEEIWMHLADMAEDKDLIRDGMADILYYLIELWASCDLPPREVLQILQKKVK
jgi:phosphoribosyl-AMP cyclohydrolase/phosphoribosyl-ATP pyrophosphohydrolase